MGKLKNGYIQVYTGDGKGKTSAAVGLAMRAAGNGYKVIMVQFLKGGSTGELNSAEKLIPYFQILRFEKKRGFFWTLNDREKEELKGEIQQAYDFCLSVFDEGKCDILILDEIMGTISNGLVTKDAMIELLKRKPGNMELIMTGRNVPDYILERADLVTEMNEIKHYFNKGVPAREGIEF